MSTLPLLLWYNPRQVHRKNLGYDRRAKGLKIQEPVRIFTCSTIFTNKKLETAPRRGNDNINTIASSSRQIDSSNLLAPNYYLEPQQSELARVVESNMDPSPDESPDNEEVEDDQEDEDGENYQVVVNNSNQSSTFMMV